MTYSPEKRSLNILVINWQDRTNPQAGGAEVHIHEVFGRIARMGHRVTLLCNRQRGALREERMDGMRVVRRGNRVTINYVNPFAYRKLRKSERFDVVVEGMNKLPYLAPLYVKEPLLVIVHHLFGATAYSQATFPAAVYVTAFEKLMAPIYRRELFEVISPSTADDLAERGIGKDQTRVVYCGMEHKLYNRAENAEKAAYPLILSIGRIKKYKSIQHIIDAMPAIRARMPGARLVVVGEGDYLPELRKQTTGLGLEDAVTFTGFVSMEKKLALMREAHVMVNPSPKEGWGLTVIESSACGTVVCASDAPGLRDSVLDGETGLLFRHGDIDDMTDKICRVLEDDGMRASMETRGLEYAATFTWEKAAVETLAAAREAIRRARAAD